MLKNFNVSEHKVIYKMCTLNPFFRPKQAFPEPAEWIACIWPNEPNEYKFLAELK